MANADDAKTVGTCLDADTDDCQARVFRRKLPEVTCFQHLPSEFEHRAHNRLSKNTRALRANLHPTGDRVKAAKDRHETGLMVQAEQHLLRRAAVTLRVRSVGEKKINQIHE